jgi:hypothetical protein
MYDYYFQKNITLSPEQEKYVKENAGKMTNGKIAIALGITYNKLHKNMGLMGLVKRKGDIAKVISMEGYFDTNKFFSYYRY